MDAPPATSAIAPGELGLAAALAVVAWIVVASVTAPLGLGGAVLAPALGFALPACLVAARHGGARRALGLEWPRARVLAGAALVGGTFWLLVLVVLAPVLAELPDRERTEQALAPLLDGAVPLPARLALFALVPAVCEEVLCRGLLCRHLAARTGPTLAIAIAAIYFAALHMSLSQGLPALLSGAAFGAVALLGRSTIAAIMTHLVHNAAVLLAAAPELEVGAWVASAPVAAVAVVGLGMVLGFGLIASEARLRE
jgi:sodium transport system permease protein